MKMEYVVFDAFKNLLSPEARVCRGKNAKNRGEIVVGIAKIAVLSR